MTITKTNNPYIVTQAIFDEIARVTSKNTPQTRTFLAKLIRDSIRRAQQKKSQWIPYPGSKLRKVEWNELATRNARVRQNLILVEPHKRHERRCREFHLATPFLKYYLRLLEDNYVNNDPNEYIDLISGKPQRKVIVNSGKDDKGISHPPLIRKSLKSIKCRPFNKQSIKNYLITKRKSLSSPKELARYLVDLSCWVSIQNQKPKQVDGDIFEYKAAYSVQKSGRIGEFGGGLQNASRDMKSIAYTGIPELKNYDLKASQACGLIQQFDDCGFDTSWLIDYRDNPSAKDEYATKIGIDVDTWKDCLIALLMGAGTKLGDGVHKHLDRYCSENGIPEEDSEELLATFLRETDTLRAPLRKWHYHLTNKYLESSNAFKYKGRIGIKNPTGKKLYIDEIKSRKSSKIAAFILQGQEAAFIHHLTVLSTKYGYSVVGNEHDGLITIGEIPQGAIDEAEQLSGLRNPILIEKPFI